MITRFLARGAGAADLEQRPASERTPSDSRHIVPLRWLVPAFGFTQTISEYYRCATNRGSFCSNVVRASDNVMPIAASVHTPQATRLLSLSGSGRCRMWRIEQGERPPLQFQTAPHLTQRSSPCRCRRNANGCFTFDITHSSSMARNLTRGPNIQKR